MHIAALHRQAAAPVRHRCMGRDLVPMTIGHMELLEQMECESPANVQDLGTAVLICSRPWHEWKAFASSVLMPWRMWRWKMQLGEWDFVRECIAFHDYLAENATGPAIAPPAHAKGDPMPSVVPFSRYIRVFLCAKLGASPDTVRDYSVRDALWDHATFAEMDGRGTVEALPYDERVAAMEAMMPPDEVLIAMSKGKA